ncbi:NADH-quinone oxidoreductase subunit J [Mariniluteicoccus endophyticus]
MVTASAVAFWVLAPFMVLGALGMILSKKAVHSAMSLAVVMVSLAVQYAAQGAPFLFAVQIIVYTGAILMLFLFVLMLVGVDARDSLVETLRGQRVMAIIAALAFGALLIFVVGNAVVESQVVGIDGANVVRNADGTLNPQGNVTALAYLIFSRYVFVFETTSALLITAALGAMVLAHRERVGEKITQRAKMGERMQAYAKTGKHPGPLPTPGVFARHNAVDTPALLPDGSMAEGSVSPTLVRRGTVVDGHALAEATRHTVAALDGDASSVNGAPASSLPARAIDEAEGEK